MLDTMPLAPAAFNHANFQKVPITGILQKGIFLWFFTYYFKHKDLSYCAVSYEG